MLITLGLTLTEFGYIRLGVGSPAPPTVSEYSSTSILSDETELTMDAEGTP